MRYLDTGSNDPGQTLGKWLELNCKEEVSSFKAQFGYFSFAAVRPFVKVFRSLSDRAATVDFVLGSNSSSLRRTDLESLVEAVGGSSSTITVVAFENAQFHPKTAHVSLADGSMDAIVTSANLTVRGTSRNVEAGITLSTRDGDDRSVLKEIEGAIDRWKISSDAGVYRVNSLADIRALKNDGVIGEELIDTFTNKSNTRKDGRKLRGSRSPLWRPAIEGVRKVRMNIGGEERTIDVPLVQRTVSPRIWFKQMKRSDAQWVDREGTNVTGKLRLTKEEFDIDHQTFFVQQFFSNVLWEPELRSTGKTYIVAYVNFDITIGSILLGRRTLKIDYAGHREADQGNVSTVLSWGREISEILRADDYRDWWVVLERKESGDFSLRIQKSRPE
jgi:hypothetical protein